MNNAENGVILLLTVLRTFDWVNNFLKARECILRKRYFAFNITDPRHTRHQNIFRENMVSSWKRTPSAHTYLALGLRLDHQGGTPEPRLLIAPRDVDVRHIRKWRLLGVRNFW